MSLQFQQHYPWVANPWRSDSLSKALKLHSAHRPALSIQQDTPHEPGRDKEAAKLQARDSGPELGLSMWSG